MQPKPIEVGEISGESLRLYALSRGTHDIAARMIVTKQRLHGLTQSLALALILDTRRDTDTTTARHEHHVSRRQRNEGRQPRALGTHRILDDLHDEIVTRIDESADVDIFIARGCREPSGPTGGSRRRHSLRIKMRFGAHDIVGVQKGRTSEPGIDECSLHAGQHSCHTAFVDIADEPAPTLAFDKQLLQHATLE